ncbi:MAG TPA: sigma factor-like helix-turn-helix DNA-binding protein [Candidatus Limnocylindrales bacterium]|nr:sigma factor-like helix-turn-helix DNA-binding protein [Candidatus Limnocylindrales bacterium]
MTPPATGIVLFGDVVDSRRDPGSTAWLRSLRADLDAAYPRPERLAAFGFTQGDEVQGLLGLAADPFRGVLRAGLRPDARALRWAIVAGPVEPGSGPATERTGTAFHVAREVLARAKAQRLGLVAITGDTATDALLADIAPLLPALLDELTPRQREIGRLIIVDELRRAEAAERLHVSRATVSVIADRGHVRHLQGLARAIATLFAEGVARSRRGVRQTDTGSAA